MLLLRTSCRPARSSGISHKRRGRAMKKDRYFKKYKKAPPPEDCGQRVNSKGMLVEFVKVYNDDSSSWDFSEGSDEQVVARTTLDDGSMIIDAEQMQTQFQAASAMVRGSSGRGQERTELPGFNPSWQCISTQTYSLCLSLLNISLSFCHVGSHQFEF